jgi:23S rRNA (adenine2503-C2)-methyltransferase
MEASSILSLSIKQLGEIMGGTGKAKIIWEHFRKGENPLEAPIVEGTLTEKARSRVLSHLNGASIIPNKIVSESLSSCGTRKMLLKLADNLEIESVLIPSIKYDRTTLCVSTQIGCDRRCAFCLTGKMGLIRNLTASEIVGQVIRGLEISRREAMPPMTNGKNQIYIESFNAKFVFLAIFIISVVFMGMGDAGRNLAAVGEAVECMTDPFRLSFSQSKITISTVGPSPETFMEIAKFPATIAWSLHSPNDLLRKQLVPSTRHTTLELREGLLKALETRTSEKKRILMIALTLIDGINDSEVDAEELAQFVLPMLTICKRIAIDLIPYNDIHIPGFQRPSRDKVNRFQQVIRKYNIFCSVRITRGEEESAACGMLATSAKRQRLPETPSIVA